MLKCSYLWGLLAAFTYSISDARADWREDLVRALKNGSVYAQDEDGRIIVKHRGDEPFIPASVLKVATCSCAQQILGPQYRFKTRFLMDQTNTLFIQGRGDPSITSEALSTISAAISKRTKMIRRIVVDESFFAPSLEIDGASATTNPYDAPNGAFIVNYNTIMVRKSASGKITSGEPQTPLTPLAVSKAKSLPPGEQRVNIGKDPHIGAHYGAELLAEFLRQDGVNVGTAYSSGSVPKSATLIYEYLSEPLNEIMRGLLKFSTNFTANQILLVMGAEKLGGPAQVEKGTSVLTNCLSSRFGWSKFSVNEGAGLSRKNRVSAHQIVELLKSARSIRDLLPVEKSFRAKTGTLTGVNSYAGFLTLADGRNVVFAILINDDVPADYKFKVAEILRRGANQE